MTLSIKPILLTADSHLLFWKVDGSYFLEQIVANIETPDPLAVYIGASNANLPEFYDIFEVAMNNVGIRRCHMLIDGENASDILQRADLILLAGGDVNLGWTYFQKSGIADLLKICYQEGALLIGTSAGAIQLGQGYYSSGENIWQNMLSIVPHCIDAHQEVDNWQHLSATAKYKPGYSCIGMPSGGGLICHSDGSIQAIRQPLQTFIFQEDTLRAITLQGSNKPEAKNTVSKIHKLSPR